VLTTGASTLVDPKKESAGRLLVATLRDEHVDDLA
jgi:hypothetical protein